MSGAYTTARQGLIKQGMTRYQIKTGSFNLSQDSYIREILFKKDSQELKPRVKSCFDNNGTFVVVLFGWDNPEIADDQIEKKFRVQIESADPKYKVAKIEIWRQNQNDIRVGRKYIKSKNGVDCLHKSFRADNNR